MLPFLSKGRNPSSNTRTHGVPHRDTSPPPPVITVDDDARMSVASRTVGFISPPQRISIGTDDSLENDNAPPVMKRGATASSVGGFSSVVSVISGSDGGYIRDFPNDDPSSAVHVTIEGIPDLDSVDTDDIRPSDQFLITSTADDDDKTLTRPQAPSPHYHSATTLNPTLPYVQPKRIDTRTRPTTSSSTSSVFATWRNTHDDETSTASLDTCIDRTSMKFSVDPELVAASFIGPIVTVDPRRISTGSSLSRAGSLGASSMMVENGADDMNLRSGDEGRVNVPHRLP
ncbi:hypothetical protein BC829DRAFT_60345 [Chytridium lagenaria]|nr:hypothetical protein BC829DRAFT_60345 [Chytridium lagenaria]